MDAVHPGRTEPPAPRQPEAQERPNRRMVDRLSPELRMEKYILLSMDGKLLGPELSRIRSGTAALGAWRGTAAECFLGCCGILRSPNHARSPGRTLGGRPGADGASPPRLRHLSLPQRWPCRWNARTLTYPRTCPPATSAASAVPCPPSHCPPAPRPPPSSGAARTFSALAGSRRDSASW